MTDNSEGAPPFKRKIRTKKVWLYFYIGLSATVVSADEKLPEDPTKIVTKAGFSLADELSLSGSIGLDETRKINARINEQATEWRVGGSWLFKRGIVNFNIGQNEFDNGASQTNYSIGTFIPLSIFGMTPGGWQIFPMAGYTYNDGNVAIENLETDIQSDYILMPTASHGGYLGAFALRPLTDRWTLMSFGGDVGPKTDCQSCKHCYWIYDHGAK